MRAQTSITSKTAPISRVFLLEFLTLPLGSCPSLYAEVLSIETVL